MCRHIARDDGPRSDHSSFADPDVRQDYAVGPHEDIVFDDNLPVAAGAAWSPIEVRQYGSPEADRAVVANRQRRRMQVVDVDVQSQPHLFPNRRATPALERRSDGVATREDERQAVEKCGQDPVHGAGVAKCLYRLADVASPSRLHSS